MSDERPGALVAVVGDGDSLAEQDPRRRFAFELGRRLVDADFRIVCGGRGGVMSAVAEGARTSPGWAPSSTIGLLPEGDLGTANPHLGLALPTGLGLARNFLVAQADALVAVGGGAGTLSEIAFAWQLRRLVIAARVEGWSGRLADAPIDERVRFSSIPDDRVYGADDPAEAVGLLQRLLSSYSPR
jgi:uncharacterized protein (TIGR00725 family)